ncbi:conserved hypothetical protein [Streptomyces viridosporus ATCC 14672]|uniref:Transposase n=1 Tax=Streptomyces viridosporus (strain ATCC 14672 / DSM 40746 / JCM 4963 / KCTC 9882 / NRRL B-12104 / FH 1290) TaxID=566461 RepID=D5ZVF6_STRV1|nr:conserved hypothetical protein [Streptomyces viridosporus ATCC 14672]
MHDGSGGAVGAGRVVDTVPAGGPADGGLGERGARGELDWSWCAIDSVSLRAAQGGPLTGPNPTDRGKPMRPGVPQRLACGYVRASTHHAVCRTGGGHGEGDRVAAPSTPGRGVQEVPDQAGPGGPAEPGRASGAGQLRCPRDPGAQNVAAGHKTVQALEKDIRAWIAAWNTGPDPSMWTKTTDEILLRSRGPRRGLFRSVPDQRPWRALTLSPKVQFFEPSQLMDHVMRPLRLVP